MALKRGADGGHRVRVVVPPQVQSGDYFAHRGAKGLFIKRTGDGRYVESKEEDVWERQPDARSDEPTAACPIGPVPDPRPDFMTITVWTHKQRPSEALEAATHAVEADEAVLGASASGDDDGDGDDDADNESDMDDEGGEAEEGEAGPTAPALAASAPSRWGEGIVGTRVGCVGRSG